MVCSLAIHRKITQSIIAFMWELKHVCFFIEVEDRLEAVRDLKGGKEVKIEGVGDYLKNIGGQEMWLSLAQCDDSSYEATVYLGLVTYEN